MDSVIRNGFLLFTFALVFTLSARTASAHEGHAHTAMGTVAAITAERFDVKTAEGKVEMFVLNSETKLDRAGKTETWDKIAVGERVVVHSKEVDGKKVAQHVQLGAKVAEPKTVGMAIDGPRSDR